MGSEVVGEGAGEAGWGPKEGHRQGVATVFFSLFFFFSSSSFIYLSCFWSASAKRKRRASVLHVWGASDVISRRNRVGPTAVFGKVPVQVKNECVSRQTNIRCERIRLLPWLTRMSGFISREEFLFFFLSVISSVSSCSTYVDAWRRDRKKKERKKPQIIKWNEIKRKKVCLWDGTVRADDSLLSSRRRGQSTQKDHFYFPFLFLLSILAFFFRSWVRAWTNRAASSSRPVLTLVVVFLFFFVSFLFVWFFGRVDVVIFDLGDGGRLNWRKMEMTKWEETKRPAVVGPSTEKNLTSRLVHLRSVCVCVDRGLGHHLCTAPTSFSNFCGFHDEKKASP